MKKKNLSKLEYNLELKKVTEEIKKHKAKHILLQFPDGLKPYASLVQKELEKSCKNTEFFIFLDSCFGACDVPLEVEKLGIDMIVQFGHSAWPYKRKDITSLP